MAKIEDTKGLFSDRCKEKFTDEDGTVLVCLKTEGHEKSNDAKRATHYDIDAERYFGAPGKIEILVKVPGQELIILTEALPKGWANMTDDQHRNHLGWREEDTRDYIEVSAEYNPKA